MRIEVVVTLQVGLGNGVTIGKGDYVSSTSYFQLDRDHSLSFDGT
jgi:hypothetical protein